MSKDLRDLPKQMSKDPKFPQEIVFSFYQGREAAISAVVIDTATYEAAIDGGENLFKLPKHVEVWASTTSAIDGFSRIAGARLQRRPAQHLIALPATSCSSVLEVGLSSRRCIRRRANYQPRKPVEADGTGDTES